MQCMPYNQIDTNTVACFALNICISRSAPKGRRLGYMGHLIDMFDSLNLLVLVSHQFRALVESSLAADEMDDWNSIIDPTDGKLTASLKAQKSFLVSLRFFWFMQNAINSRYGWRVFFAVL